MGTQHDTHRIATNRAELVFDMGSWLASAHRADARARQRMAQDDAPLGALVTAHPLGTLAAFAILLIAAGLVL